MNLPQEPAPSDESGKQPYSSPKLQVYGSMDQVVLTVGKKGRPDAGNNPGGNNFTH